MIRAYSVQLANTEEFQDGVSNGTLGEVFIRCNNVLYIMSLALLPGITFKLTLSLQGGTAGVNTHTRKCATLPHAFAA